MRQTDRDFVEMVSRDLANFPGDFQNEMSGCKSDYFRLLSAHAVAEIAIENNDAACRIMSQVELLRGGQIDLFEGGYL